MSENAGLIKKTLFEVYFISLKANKYKWNNYSVIVNDSPSRCDVITVFFPVSFTHWKNAEYFGWAENKITVTMKINLYFFHYVEIDY